MLESMELSCPACDYTAICSPAAMVEWLKGVRMLRRDGRPEPELIGELFRSAAGKYVCPKCGGRGLAVQAVDEGDDEAWGMARACEGCGQPIARERLEALPETRVCAACQGRDERGEASGAVEYCPKCGGVMEVRQTGGAGVTRYAMRCTSCRR
jgi:hypothetical protein